MKKLMLMRPCKILIMALRLIVNVSAIYPLELSTNGLPLEILRPLTSAAELPNHPSLSAPYQSTILEGIINETSEMLYGERKALWHAKGLMTDLRGDGCWLPCGLFHTEQDESIFDTEALYTTDIAQEIKRLRSSSSQKCQSSGCKSQHKGHDDVPAVNGTLDRVEPIAPPANKSTTQPSNDIVMEHGAKSPGDNGTVVQDESRNQISDVRPVESSKMATNLRESHINESAASIISRQEISETSAASNALPSPAASPERHAEQAGNGEDQNVAEVAVSAKGPDATDAMDADGEHAAPQAVPHRMTTRAQAQAVSEQHSSTHTHTPSPSDSIPLFIHPLFLTPEESRPDQNFGLSPGEGEDTRILFSHYIQKQEEIVRGTEKLLHGLLRALRLRKNVYRWCKAESHVGEMSDGEDWYDMEEWGLDEPLRKGHDDEEEDPVQGKKTRARRAG